jgi:hypothetical protein
MNSIQAKPQPHRKRRGRRLVSAKCREKMKAKRNKLFITQCVATTEQAAAGAVLPYFAGGNKSLAVNGL